MMKIPFLNQLQRLTGPVTNEVRLAVSGPESNNIEQTIQYLLDELPDLLMAAVVDVATGKPLASYTTDRDLRPGSVVGFDAAAVRQVQASLLVQGLTEETLEEILLTLPSQLHLLRLVPGGHTFICLAVDCLDTNLAIAREVMRGSIRVLAPFVDK